MSKDINLPLSKLVTWRRHPKGDVGIEIEIEGGPWPVDKIPNWQVHEDHSLRVHPKTQQPGREYIIAQPIAADSVLTHVEVLRKALGETLTEFTYRTSVHVHVNVQRMSVRQWVSFLALSILFEEALVDIVGPTRVGNKFCLRTVDAEGALQDLCKAIRIGKLSGFLGRGGGATYKYGAINLNSTSTHGTVEFRAMEGNLDAQRIGDWARVLCGLRDSAMTITDPRRVIEQFSLMGPEAFTQEFIKDGAIKTALFNDFRLADKLWRGARYAQDLGYASNWEGKMEEEVSPIENNTLDDGIIPEEEEEDFALLRRVRSRPQVNPATGNLDTDF